MEGAGMKAGNVPYYGDNLDILRGHDQDEDGRQYVLARRGLWPDQ